MFQTYPILERSEQRQLTVLRGKYGRRDRPSLRKRREKRERGKKDPVDRKKGSIPKWSIWGGERNDVKKRRVIGATKKEKYAPRGTPMGDVGIFLGCRDD